MAALIAQFIGCSASVQPQRAPAESAAVASAPSEAVPASPAPNVEPPAPVTPVVAAAPEWESDARYVECVKRHVTRTARDRCYVQTKRALAKKASEPPPPVEPKKVEWASTSVVEPEHPTAPASAGWRLTHRAGPTRGIDVEYESAADVKASIRRRMEMELQPEAKIKSALRSIKPGGVVSVGFIRDSLDESDPRAWLVVLRSSGRQIVRHRGSLDHRSATGQGYSGFLWVSVPRFSPPLEIFVVPPGGNYRYEYLLEAGTPTAN